MSSPRAALLCLTVLASAGCNLLRGPPRDHECRSTLRQIIGLENAYFSQRQKYSVHPVEISWAPSQGNRYLYLFAADGQLTRRDELASPALSESVGYGPDTKKRGVLLEDLLLKFPPELKGTLGVEGVCPSCSVTIGCIGNVDDDAELDVWTISSKDRTGAARGTPVHHVKDL